MPAGTSPGKALFKVFLKQGQKLTSGRTLYANSEDFTSCCANKVVAFQRRTGDLSLGGKPELLEFSNYFNVRVSTQIPMDDRALSCPGYKVRETNL